MLLPITAGRYKSAKPTKNAGAANWLLVFALTQGEALKVL
ncbi:MAG: hypothetical protein Ct9H300mP6_03210 [Gammaproteobacteria bacterium]|nr:MAG: hypothetical protein Ct9H300mP6_03210 [Gammaproteobacteria bacterium]